MSKLAGVVLTKLDNPLADYTLHVCAFIDILGFAEWVKGIPEKPRQFEETLSLLNELKARTDSTQYEDGEPCLYSRKITAFSDSIVISYPTHERGAGRALCRDVVWLTRRLLTLGFLPRGAAAVGRLYHRDDVVFGDALNDAYNLERKVAIYPRIILQDALLESDAWSNDAKLIQNEPESSQRDSDGVWFLNPMHVGAWSVDFNSSPVEFLKTVRRTILLAYKDAAGKAPEARVKCAWLANQFNNSLEKAKAYQARIRTGKIVANFLLPDNDFSCIRRIECQDWVLLPLNENAKAACHRADQNQPLRGTSSEAI